MAFDAGLAERVRVATNQLPNMEEKKMFGSLAFMHNDHMLVGVMSDGLMVRVGKDNYEATLQRNGARPLDMTGRRMKGFIVVDMAAIADADSLNDWVQHALTYVQTLPPKKKK